MRFDSPVGTAAERDSDRMPVGEWYDATGFDTLYGATGKQAYHTGNDFNLPADADYRQPVYAVADGLCVWSATVPAWFHIIITKHTLEDGSIVYARYAHVEQPAIKPGESVLRGQQIAVVGTYQSQDGKTKNHHLHFDIARADLGLHPGDWPGMDNARLLRDYFDPMKFIQEHHQEVTSDPKEAI